MLDFIAIGDTTVDEFIQLTQATIHCDEQGENCTIAMPWGDKIPYDFSVRVPGVGNAANAAVAAARLGLNTGFISNVGDDSHGKDILEVFKHEGIDTRYVRVNTGSPTNHDYVLMYNAERTILVKHEDYSYSVPADLKPAKWLYLSSAGQSEQFHLDLAAWVVAHPEAKLAFQPSTFEMAMGVEKLAPLYRASALVACNKEEAERILGLGETDIKELLEKMHALGPKLMLITDGPNGSYASDGETVYRVPMYPDSKKPIDRTGAGDATTSSVVAALALDKSLSEALRWGPINAMSVVQEIGAQKGLLKRDTLEKFLADAPAEYAVTTV